MQNFQQTKVRYKNNSTHTLFAIFDIYMVQHTSFNKYPINCFWMVIFEGLKQQFLEFFVFKADTWDTLLVFIFLELSLYNSLKSVVGGFLS